MSDRPMIVPWLLRGCAAVALAAVSAAPAAAAEDEQLWTSASANVKLSDRWRLSQEATARFSDNRKGLYEIELNTLLGYRLNGNVTVWAGYTHSPQYSHGDVTAKEHRIREQVTFDRIGTIGRGKLSGRLRLEQRWREHVDGTGWRLRPYVKYSLPVANGARTALVVSHETYVNLNENSFQSAGGIDRMRNFIGVSTPLATNLSLEAGYLNQHGFVRGGGDSSDHVASISLGLSL